MFICLLLLSLKVLFHIVLCGFGSLLFEPASNKSHRVILSDYRTEDQEPSISGTVSCNDKILLLEKLLNFSEMLSGVDE